jgi:hypothetical protein
MHATLPLLPRLQPARPVAAAQSFARLGSAVTQVEMAPRIMLREDPEVSELVAASLRADGVSVLTGHQAVRVEVVDGEKRLMAKHGHAEVVIALDELLCAVGRSPRVTGYGLEELGIPLDPRKTRPSTTATRPGRRCCASTCGCCAAARPRRCTTPASPPTAPALKAYLDSLSAVTPAAFSRLDRPSARPS